MNDRSFGQKKVKEDLIFFFYKRSFWNFFFFGTSSLNYARFIFHLQMLINYCYKVVKHSFGFQSHHYTFWSNLSLKSNTFRVNLIFLKVNQSFFQTSIKPKKKLKEHRFLCCTTVICWIHPTITLRSYYQPYIKWNDKTKSAIWSTLQLTVIQRLTAFKTSIRI